MITARSSRGVYRDDGAGIVFIGTRDNWRVPDHVTAADLAAAREALAMLAGALRPAEDDEKGEETVKARISGTYAHFPVQNRDEGLWKIVFGDYWRCMKRYPMWAIFAACEEWVDTQKWAPRLADLREMIEAKISDLKRDADRLQSILDRHDPDRQEQSEADQSGYGGERKLLPSLRRMSDQR